MGKISSQTDNLSGETVQYIYDSLNRLVTAAANGSWGEQYSHDGFGNLTDKTPTAGSSTPSLHQMVNANNQIVGAGYDANGNYGGPGGYDIENRFINGYAYAYDPRNKLVWRTGTYDSYGNATGYQIYFYGVDGKRLGVYQMTAYALWGGNDISKYVLLGGPVSTDTYLGGRRLDVEDRMGSVGTYYPYGEEKGTGNPPNDNWKFATYWRDSLSGWDYADQRWYVSGQGRF